MFVLFGRYEVHRSRAGGDPLILASLFRKRAFLGGMATGTIYFAAFSGFGLVFNLYLQLGLGFSPLRAAVAGIPLSIGMIVGMGVVQAVMRHGRKVLHAGAVTMTAGVLILLPLLGSEAGFWQLAPALLVTGMGAGLIMGPYFDIVLAASTRTRPARPPAPSPPFNRSVARSERPYSAPCSSARWTPTPPPPPATPSGSSPG
ncbi:MFS transporter [Streptosporangium lutulentum]